MKTALATLFAVLLACLSTSTTAQVVKCKGPGGKVIYSDTPCPEGLQGQEINTQANVLDTSAERAHSARSKAQERITASENEARALMQSPPKECQFRHFALGDSKGKVLAENAKRECVENLFAERSGRSTSDRHYRLWRDHYDSERASRDRAVAQSQEQMRQAQSQPSLPIHQNPNKTYRCTPDGMGTISCR